MTRHLAMPQQLQTSHQTADIPLLLSVTVMHTDKCSDTVFFLMQTPGPLTCASCGAPKPKHKCSACAEVRFACSLVQGSPCMPVGSLAALDKPKISQLSSSSHCIQVAVQDETTSQHVWIRCGSSCAWLMWCCFIAVCTPCAHTVAATLLCSVCRCHTAGRLAKSSTGQQGTLWHAVRHYRPPHHQTVLHLK